MKDSYREYLTAIYKLNSRNKNANNKSISEWLNISPPSVTVMLKKMKNDGLINMENSVVTLTDLGVKEAQLTLSKHRLWEYFLREVLNYDWEEVHEDAKMLQYATSQRLLNKINNYLNYPKYCPHGENIFINNNEIRENIIPLIEGEVGSWYKIVKVSDIKSFLEYFTQKGLNIGFKFELGKYNKFDDNLTLIDEKENKIFIGNSAASHIYVEKIG